MKRNTVYTNVKVTQTFAFQNKRKKIASWTGDSKGFQSKHLHNVTLITVQCFKDAVSQGRGLSSLLGTPEGSFPATPNDNAAHANTIKGTP
jgi:hypothetical protein